LQLGLCRKCLLGSPKNPIAVFVTLNAEMMQIFEPRIISFLFFLQRLTNRLYKPMHLQVCKITGVFSTDNLLGWCTCFLDRHHIFFLPSSLLFPSLFPPSSFLFFLPSYSTRQNIRLMPDSFYSFYVQEVGGFPSRTITEDYVLGMELCKCGYKAHYVMEYLAAGTMVHALSCPTLLCTLEKSRLRILPGP
jgi:hypothetical protein